MPSDLPEPWRSFLRDLDTQLAGPTELHCFGGFVVAQCYGLTRPTADIDILESKGTDLITIAKLAGSRVNPLRFRKGAQVLRTRESYAPAAAGRRGLANASNHATRPTTATYHSADARR